MSGTVWSKFYWSDWLSDAGLRRSSFAARGLWIDMLSIAAQSDPIGFLSVNNVALSVNDIARMVGGSEPEVRTLIDELSRNGVLSRNRAGTIYNRRMVRDAKKRRTAQNNGKLGGNPRLCKDEGISPSDNLQDKGGLNTHIPETRNQKEKEDAVAFATPPPVSSQETDLFRRGKEILGANSGGMIAKLLKSKGRIELARAALETAATKEDPREYVGAIINGHDERRAVNEYRW